jgi:hypothetical protein
MIGTTSLLRSLAVTILLGAGLAGCSDGVEINSPLLSTVGGALGVGAKKQEAQLADRPEPGTGAAVAAQVNAQLPQGPEQVAAAAAAAKKKKQDEACQLAAQNRKDTSLQAACPGLIAKLTAPAADGPAQ